MYRNGNEATKKILVKSVGWGWLGYHAYHAGNRLRGFVPEIFGVRNGFIFMEWVEGTPLSRTEMSAAVLDRLSSLRERDCCPLTRIRGWITRRSVGDGWKLSGF
jgi:hypothetical protein